MDATADSLESLLRAGLQAMQQGEAGVARSAFEQVAASGRATTQLWLLLADACIADRDHDRANEALDKVLDSEPRNVFALLLKGDIYMARSDDRAAIAFLKRALATASTEVQLPGDLPQRLQAAEEKIQALESRFEDHLAQCIAEAGIQTVPYRMAEAIRIAAGRQDIYLQQPTSFYYPGLPQRAWYDPSEFDWIEPFEDAASDLATEVQAALDDRSGLVPYVENSADRPAGGHSLLNDPRWSAFHLLQNGVSVEENARRCPLAMKLLAAAPIPVIDGRSPMAMISVLQPGTHIPPHSGMLNTRLICHVPLIVPDGCRLRVGGETRAVRFGKAMIFDDSIEHEAWNDGSSTRAVLLFEVWRPELSEGERNCLTAVFNSINAYGRDDE